MKNSKKQAGKPEITIVYSDTKSDRSLKLAYRILAEHILKKAGKLK